MYNHRVLFRIPNPFHREYDWFPNLLRLSLTTGSKGNKHTEHWILELAFGRGAGYIWGRTLWLAHNALDVKHRHLYTRTKWAGGFTQNANLIPWGDGL